MGAIIDEFTGADDAADAAREGSALAAAGQQRALDYQMQQEAMPSAYRDAAMQALGSEYGFTYNPASDGMASNEATVGLGAGSFGGQPPVASPRAMGWRGGGGARSGSLMGMAKGLMDERDYQAQQAQNAPVGTPASVSYAGGSAVDRAMESPLYAAIMGTRQGGEDAIMRNASMTGGLRSGNTNTNLSDYNMQLENRALLSSYDQQMQGLRGFAGLGNNTAGIAQSMAGIGQTQGQGAAAAGQAIQQGRGMLVGGGLNLASGGLAGGYF